MRRWLLVLFVTALATSFVPARRTAPAPRENAWRIGLVFDIGGRGDKSFNDAAYAGLIRAQAELGVDARYLEPASSEDRESALRLFAAQGLDMVIGVGFIFSSDVNAVARDYPAVRFACVDYAPMGQPIPANVVGIAFKEEEGSFLVGAVAGLMTKSHKVGFVGGMRMPLIERFEAGYKLGISSVCPSCELLSGYAGASPEAFKDPAKGKAIALSQIGNGVDIVYHASGATGRGVFEGAREGRALAIGVDSDQHSEMPGVVVTSMVKRVDVALFELLRRLQGGHFESGMKLFGVRDGAIDYVHEGPHASDLPAEVVNKVEALRRELVAGERRVEVVR
jgi:basic membrane protein A